MTKKNKANKNALSYFISLHEPRPTDSQEFSPQRWDQRAEFWKKERIKKRKGDERVISDVSYLEEKGLLQKHFDVADIGCGPGRFVAAFARRVHRAVGLDISEKMIAHGMEYLKEEQLTNASLHTCDFQSLDLDKEGYRKAFRHISRCGELSFFNAVDSDNRITVVGIGIYNFFNCACYCNNFTHYFAPIRLLCRLKFL